MIRSLSFHFKSAIKNLFRHFGMTLLSLTGITIILTLIATFVVSSVNIGAITNGITKNIKIQALVDPVVTAEEIKTLQSAIQSIDGVESVVHKTKHEELESFIKNTTTGNQESAFAQYRGAENPLKDAFYVTLKNQDSLIGSTDQTQKQRLQEIRQKISEIKGITNVFYGGASVEKLIVLLSNIKIIGYVITAILGVLSIFLIQNTIKSTIYARQTEIAIMRNVGASNGFIKVPFMIEGIIIGLIGSIIPSVIVILGYPSLYKIVNAVKIVKMIEVQPFVYQVALILAGIGMVIGLFGAFLSTTKYLRFKR